jgi:release factor glutamine methyltransferase
MATGPSPPSREAAWSAAAPVRDARTVGAALERATQVLQAAGIDSARLDALLLLAAVLSTTKTELLAHPERPLEAAQAAVYLELVARRAAREPLAYILGRREFYGREFVITPQVLVPRPETELLVDLALEHLRRHRLTDGCAADVGAGSGVLAVTLAVEWPALRVVATDLAPALLALVRANAARFGVAHRIWLVCCDLLAGVRGPLDLVVANLPYIPTGRIATLMPEVAWYEPRRALDGGPDGTVPNRRLLAQLPERLAPGGLALLECDEEQAATLQAVASRYLPDAAVTVVKDLTGSDRALRIERRP